MSDFLSCALLCESMVFLMFGRQLYDNLRVLRLNIVLSMWSTGKLLSIIFRNALSTLVFTLRSNGGLYHVIFLDLFLLFLLFPVVSGLYSNLYVYPLLASAAWFSGVALLKMSSFDDISESRLFIPSGTALMMEGGWLLLVWMYMGAFPGLRYGWCVPICRLNVTSKRHIYYLLVCVYGDFQPLFWPKAQLALRSLI